MPRRLPAFVPALVSLGSGALFGCLSYPELVTLEEQPATRDASVSPDGTAQSIGLGSDSGLDADENVYPDRDAAKNPDVVAPPPPPPPRDAGVPSPPPPADCEACPPGTKCCKKNSGKGKGEITCKPPNAECGDG